MFYLITGATNAGKDKIAQFMIEEYGLTPIISTTSRPIRPKELEGKEYYFLTKEEFLSRVENEEFIEHRHYDTIVKGVPERWYYGVEKKHILEDNKDYVAVIDFHGAKEFIKYFGRNKITLIYVKTTFEQRYLRNLLRGDFDPQEWERRNREDAKWLHKAMDESDYIVYNFGIDIPENPIGLEHEIDLSAETNLDVFSRFEDTTRQLKQIVRSTRGGK